MCFVFVKAYFKVACNYLNKHISFSLFYACFLCTPIQLSIKQNSRHFVSFLLSDGDDLAQYLDQLLATAVPQRRMRAEDKAGGLCRFRAAANQTREMVSLVNKAKDLQLHSEYYCCLLLPVQLACAFYPCNVFIWLFHRCANVFAHQAFPISSTIP